MKAGRTERPWIIAELLLCLAPVGLIFISPAIALGDTDKLTILISCILSSAVSAVSLWICRKSFRDDSSSLPHLLLWLIPGLLYAGLFFELIVLHNPQALSSSLINVFLGLTFLVIGNLLPKSQPNPLFGVRTKWTMKSRYNWVETSRITGRIWVIGGLLCWLAVLFKISEAASLLLILALAFTPLLVSWLIYRKQIRENSWSSDQTLSDERIYPKSVKWLGAAAGAGVLIFCLVIVFLGRNYSITIQDQTLHIDAAIVSGVDFPLDKIQSLTLRDPGSPGSRTFGYSAFDTDLGRYKNAEYGNYLRFTSGPGKVIELKGDGKTIVFSLPQEAKTLELYNRIRSLMKDGSDSQETALQKTSLFSKSSDG